jgi:hypothetical protein
MRAKLETAVNRVASSRRGIEHLPKRVLRFTPTFFPGKGFPVLTVIIGFVRLQAQSGAKFLERLIRFLVHSVDLCEVEMRFRIRRSKSNHLFGRANGFFAKIDPEVYIHQVLVINACSVLVLFYKGIEKCNGLLDLFSALIIPASERANSMFSGSAALRRS